MMSNDTICDVQMANVRFSGRGMRHTVMWCCLLLLVGGPASVLLLLLSVVSVLFMTRMFTFIMGYTRELSHRISLCRPVMEAT